MSDDIVVVNGDIVNVSFDVILRKKKNSMLSNSGLVSGIVEALYNHHTSSRNFDQVIDLIEYETYLEETFSDSIEDIMRIVPYLRPEYPPHTIYEINKYDNVVYPSIDPMIFQIYNPNSDIRVSIIEKF